MKTKVIYTWFMLLSVALLTGCYDDKGGNDFDTTLPDVVMTIPEDVYSGSLGDSIIIKPKIETSIDSNDLEYFWEVNGATTNSQKRSTFSSMLPAAQQGKELHYYCHLDSNITSLSTQYTCRLRAHQKSTGRDFYSANTFKLTIEGLTGLMVLHGDDNSFDLGILRATEFMPSASGNPEKPVATSTLYSGNNNGQKLSGKAISVMQIYPSYVSSENHDRLEVAVHSSTGYSFLSNEDFSYKGDWMHLFYLTGDRQINANKPQGLLNYGQVMLGFDDGELYMCNELNTYPFLKPNIGKTTVCGDGNTFSFAPILIPTTITSSPQAIGYANSVNGTDQKGFVLFNYFGAYASNADEAALMDTKDDQVKFNPGNMQAELVYMAAANQNTVKAVLKGDNNNTKYPGKYFAVNFDFSQSGGGESGFQSYANQIWNLSTEPDRSRMEEIDKETNSHLEGLNTEVSFPLPSDGNIKAVAQLPQKLLAGHEHCIEVFVQLKEGWHAYPDDAKTKQEGFIPTRIDVKLPKGFTPSKRKMITWPEENPLTNRFLLQSFFNVPSEKVLKGQKEFPVTVTLTYQICNEGSCLPPQTVEVKGTMKLLK